MKFVRLQATTRSFSTCRGYIRGFNHLDAYLQTLNTPIAANKINRELIVNFIQYLAQQELSPATRSITLINLRTFHQMVLLENWLDWPAKPIIFNRDFPKDSIIAPKYISKDVIAQFKTHLHWMQHFVIILMETGRRISEVCSLSFDCLEKDGDGDWLLRVNEKKLNRVRLIPVSKASSLPSSSQPPNLPNQQLTSKVIENAKQNGWQRIVEMNTTVISNLKSIITTLEHNDNDQ